MEADKINLNKAIEDGNVVTPMEYQHLVETRIRKARENPEVMLDWDEVSKTLGS